LKASKTELPEVLILEPEVFLDKRGFFFESYNQKIINEILGEDIHFVQDNHSKSSKGVIRGLHYQKENPQSKLVRVIKGSIYDVAVDIRKSSPNFGKWIAVELTEENRKQLWIPKNFAHGFCVLEEGTEVFYKTTDFYNKEQERSIKWDDKTLSIEWPVELSPFLSSSDKTAPSFIEADLPD